MTFVGRVLRVAGAVAGAAVVLGGVLWLADDVLRGLPADSAQLRPAAGRSAGTSTYAAADFAEHVTGVETEWEGDTAVRTVISTDLADDAAGRRIAVGIKVAHMQQLLADCVEKLPVVVVNDREGDEIRHGDLLSFSRQRGDDCPGRAALTS
ncbi:hypothetical protein [Streptomyces sp. CMB-StM0423]|uniref:hypothetical protein n=1 Tax=Streptomyces sp. CMB-StM0423 TaxID=2059884 RepID=UPI000C70D430|nr:hypothetical protein [Streptomyces sp. CMB-StM0423]AUH40921.1 hypothetical protein CXR04_12230 [Streptomyces sp. CMB-StM0423]